VGKLFLVLSPFVGRFFKEGNEEILLVDLSGHDRLPSASLSVCTLIPRIGGPFNRCRFRQPRLNLGP
jgi:hypothetical protein